MTRNIDVISPTPCLNCPLRPLPAFSDRSRTDIAYVQDLKAGELILQPGTAILMENVESAHLFTVLSGWAFRYKTLGDGRRQIINYALPGDLLGLQATLSDPMSHGIETLSDVVLCVFPREKLWTIYADHPQIAYDVTWLAAREERTLDEHILALGRKTAIERMAYLLWFLFDRARNVQLNKGNTVDLPLRQQHIADTLGLSLVHTNKTLQLLRESGAIKINDRRLSILDEDALKSLGQIEAPPTVQRPLI